MLRAFLCGQPHLQFGDTEFLFRARPRVLPLLAYLYCTATHRSRAQLSPMPCGPTKPKAPRRQICGGTYQLRRALPSPLEDQAWVLSDKLTVPWNLQAAYWLAVAEFEKSASRPRGFSKALAV